MSGNAPGDVLADWLFWGVVAAAIGKLLHTFTARAERSGA